MTGCMTVRLETIYLPLQQQQPPHTSPLQQHFSQQHTSPQQVQEHPLSAWTGTGFRNANGRMARAMDLNVMR
jgi:hypothetical protein